MTMRKTWAIVLGVVLLTIVPSQINSAETRGNAGSFTPSATLDLSQVESGAPVIEEDEPGWDCETMGNRVCGDSTPTPDANADDEAPTEPFDVEGTDGVIHHGCTIEIDEPSSHMICDDGYSEES